MHALACANLRILSRGCEYPPHLQHVMLLSAEYQMLYPACNLSASACVACLHDASPVVAHSVTACSACAAHNCERMRACMCVRACVCATSMGRGGLRRTLLYQASVGSTSTAPTSFLDLATRPGRGAGRCPSRALRSSCLIHPPISATAPPCACESACESAAATAFRSPTKPLRLSACGLICAHNVSRR